MTVHVVADATGLSSLQTLGFLRMSATNARAFLIDLRKGRSPIVAAGDEGGTVRIECDITDARSVFSVYETGQPEALRRWSIDRHFDLRTIADELLADLGV
jgi:hypothetical protein